MSHSRGDRGLHPARAVPRVLRVAAFSVWPWVLLAALIPGLARSAEPEMTARIGRIFLPLPSAETVDAGRVEADPARGVYAVQIDVTGGDPARGWALYLRSEQSTFSPEGAGKPCTDLRWKLDQEGPESYRRLDDHEAVVLENPAGGNTRITIDVAVDLDWHTNPGTYGLGLNFRLAGL
jgi:hypothetical protein